MRALLPVCAGIAVITGVVSVSLWRELRAERLVNVDLRAQLTDARSAPGAAAMPVSVAANAMATPATAGADAPVCKPDTPVARTAQVSSAPGFNNVQDSLTMEKDLMKDPEYRKLRIAQQRQNIERNYPGLAEALGLSEKEADKLYDVLAENQVAISAEAPIFSTANGTPDQAAIQEMGRRQQALQREQEESLRDMLGSKYTQWQDYQQTRPARSRVTSMGQQLAQAGMPLTDAQSRALTTVMISEQQRQRQDAMLTARPAGLNPADPDFQAKMMEDSLKRNEENNRRMIEAASPHISAKQVAALREQMEQQAAMTRISLKMQIERDRLRAQQQQQQ